MREDLTNGPEPVWRKSRRSGQEGNCVELARHAETVGMRNSRYPDGAELTLLPADVATFLAGIKAGDLDQVT